MAGGCGTNPAQHGRKRWLFRCAAVLLGIASLVAVEFALVAFDVGELDEWEDPYVGFDDVRPLFVLNESGSRYEIPRSRQKYFAPKSFRAKKGPETFRVFCLGGSTVQGRPYSTETSFPTWLKLSLTAADPEQEWEVSNCGGISYASYRLVPILQECLDYEPDLIILCTGHNEFLEERTYGEIKRASPALMATHRFASKLRTFRLLQAGFQSLTQDNVSTTDRPMLSTETNALLNYKNGIAAYHRDDELRATVIAHYEHNVRRMIALARRQQVPLILVQPPSNLADCPPFKSQHRDGLTATERTRWSEFVEQAKSHYRDDLSRAAQLFQQAIAIDDAYAATHYELGRCQLLTGDVDGARESFLRARELDICPLRMIEAMENSLSVAATDNDTQLVDVATLLAAECRHGILSDDILVDHVHPKFRGHQLIANELMRVMMDRGWVSPTDDDWQKDRDLRYQRHFDALEPIYFARGLRELKALRVWAAGRTDGPERVK